MFPEMAGTASVSIISMSYGISGRGKLLFPVSCTVHPFKACCYYNSLHQIHGYKEGKNKGHPGFMHGSLTVILYSRWNKRWKRMSTERGRSTVPHEPWGKLNDGPAARWVTNQTKTESTIRKMEEELESWMEIICSRQQVRRSFSGEISESILRLV